MLILATTFRVFGARPACSWFGCYMTVSVVLRSRFTTRSLELKHVWSGLVSLGQLPSMVKTFTYMAEVIVLMRVATNIVC